MRGAAQATPTWQKLRASSLRETKCRISTTDQIGHSDKCRIFRERLGLSHSLRVENQHREEQPFYLELLLIPCRGSLYT